jgi:RNA polymerase sigma-70 factor, ECF subfamily
LVKLYNAIFGNGMAGVYNGSMEFFITQHLKSVYNYVYRIINDKNEAEDITQEAFVKAWKNFKKFDQNKNFKTWLFTIARNTTIDYFRKRKNILFSELDARDNDSEKTFSENIVDMEPLPDEIFERKELTQELEKALEKIRPDFREIILLHYTEEITFQEISEVIGKPLNTVKSQHLRALHQIRELLRI